MVMVESVDIVNGYKPVFPLVAWITVDYWDIIAAKSHSSLIPEYCCLADKRFRFP
jgi:hypothetical protein